MTPRVESFRALMRESHVAECVLEVGPWQNPTTEQRAAVLSFVQSCQSHGVGAVAITRDDYAHGIAVIKNERNS